MNEQQRQLAQAKSQARALGFRVRTEWLDGCGGGYVQIGNERWILLDDMHTPAEQLDCLLRAMHAGQEPLQRAA